jgi:hypothetical protein
MLFHTTHQLQILVATYYQFVHNVIRNIYVHTYYIYIYDIKEFCIYPKSSYPHAPNSPQLATVLILRHCFWGMNFGLQLFLWFRVARPVKMFHYTPLGYMEKILSHYRVQINA